MLNAVDGCIPSDLGAGTTAELEEERRLALCRDDPGQGQSASRRAAAVLHPRAERPGRSPCLCVCARDFIPATLLQLFESTTWLRRCRGAIVRPDRIRGRCASTLAHRCAVCGGDIMCYRHKPILPIARSTERRASARARCQSGATTQDHPCGHGCVPRASVEQRDNPELRGASPSRSAERASAAWWRPRATRRANSAYARRCLRSRRSGIAPTDFRPRFDVYKAVSMQIARSLPSTRR